jgi:acyl-CoA synthetase (AMP-forming)/AMP-acid ligase II
MNNTGTLVDLLRGRAAQSGDSLAYVFLEDGRDEGARLTYADLDAGARRIAAALQADHAPGERVLLLFPAGLDFLVAFFGCLYAGLVAIPAPAPEASRRKRTMPRLQSIVSDADVTVVLSAGDTLELVRESSRSVPELERLRRVDTADLADLADGWRAPQIDPEDIAYLQYTSGSTTAPKGVMLNHRNVLHHCRDLREANGYGEDSVSVSWLPYFHDYGLIEGILVPLQNGTPGYIMSPFAFLKRPFAWLDAISRFRGTHTQGPNFAYDQCVRRVRPEQIGKLDLSSLVSAGNGAEPVNPAVVEAFYETFAPTGLKLEALCPAYGLAEATLMMSCRNYTQPPRFGSFRPDALAERRVVEVGENEPARRVTSCGRPLGQIEIAIVDPATNERLPKRAVGEIWIKDTCVALGYWKREAETEETFRARTTAGDGPFLRTGDLGFLDGGELFVTSRIKDLIIVAGANHYPQDIEWTVERCHPAIRPNHVAAGSTFAGGEERLVVAAEVERGAISGDEDHEEMLNAVRTAVTEGHEVQIHALLILRRGTLPKTASGKIQRHACDRLLHDEGEEVIARWIAGRGWVQPSLAAE